MNQMVWMSALAVALAGCSTAALPYKPEVPPPSGATISVDYGLLADRLRVEINTGGYRLEDAQIVPASGGAVRPDTIEHPAPGGSGSALGIGFGIGGATFGGGGRSAVGVESGVGMSIPVGDSSRVSGNTVVYFALNQIGPAPWRLFVKVAETGPAVIVLPPR